MRKKSKKNKRPGVIRWSLLTVLCALLTAVMVFANSIAGQFETVINMVANGKDYTIVKGEADEDTNYFTSSFASEEELIAYENELCAQVEAEGATLLLNENNALPLTKGAKVSLFARGSVELVYGGTGSGSVDTSSAPTLKDALIEQGIEVNTTLWDWYTSEEIAEKYNRIIPDGISDNLTANTTYAVNEAPWNEVKSATADSYGNYGDAAIVVFSRSGGEGADLPSGNNGADLWYSYGQEGDGDYLTLTTEERDMLAGLKELKDQGVFKKIVVLVNTSNAIELDFLNLEICGVDYGIDACMWIGGVGQTGAYGVGQLLAGVVSPSGSLVDTYCYDNLANPAVVNFYSYDYANAEDYNLIIEDGYDLQGRYVVYQEGIYLGYRYFETRYEDVVMGTGNAGDYNYNNVVAYPFGYGQSYTTFEYSDYAVSEKEDSFEISVKVTNTGDTYAGKKTVQVYFQSPYTEYDKENGIEKANVELCGFAKTKTLKSGESETVTIVVEKEELRTYDANNAKTYILDAGDYYFTVANGSHEASNNILATKGYTVENTDGRMDVDGDASLTWKWTNVQLDTTIFSVASTGNAITNLFDETDPNKSVDAPGQVTWLSRSNWVDTYPVSGDYGLLANDTMAESLAMMKYDATKVESVDMPTLGADNGLVLAQLIGKDYDDPMWEDLLDQLTFEEMVDTITLGFHTTASCPSVGKVTTKDENGPQGLTASLTGGASAMCYPSEDVMAATFNVDLINEVGKCIGEDCLAAGYSGIYAPGVNMHRTAYSGRNFEYYSEDPFISGTIAASEVKGIQEKGVYVYMKHVALNDSETSRLGVCTWANEQTIREIYLETVDKAIVDGGAWCVMSAFTRWGTTWSGSYAPLMTDYLRGECGMRGMVISDMAAYAEYMNVVDGMIAGNNIWDSMMETIHTNALKEYEDDAYVVTQMRESMHKILYTVANSNAMNGISTADTVKAATPGWQILIYGLIVFFVVATVLSGCKLIKNIKKRKIWKAEQLTMKPQTE